MYPIVDRFRPANDEINLDPSPGDFVPENGSDTQETKHHLSVHDFFVSLDSYLDRTAQIKALDPDTLCILTKTGQEWDDQLNELFSLLEFQSPKDAQLFVDTLLQKYIGEQNKDTWGILNDEDFKDISQGDHIFINLLYKTIKNSELGKQLGREKLAGLVSKILDYLISEYRQDQQDQQDQIEYENQWIEDVEQDIPNQDGNFFVFDEEDAERWVTHSEDSPFESLYMLNSVIEDFCPLGDRKTIDRLLELVKEEGVNVSRYVDRACTKIDAEYAVQTILNYLQSDESKNKVRGGDNEEKYVRTDLQRILFRIELGEIGVDEEGVNYWCKRYDLSDLNSTGNVIRRVTGYGDVGVFNRNKKELLGLFRPVSPAEDSADTQTGEPIRADVRELVLSDIFSHPATDKGSIERSKQEAILTQFKEGYYARLIGNFYREVGVYLNNLTFREQAWFLLFLGTASGEDQRRAKKLVKKFGEDGLRSFISLEIDPHSGGDIFEIAESELISKESKKRIFGKYAVLIEHLETVDQDILGFFASQNNIQLSRGEITAEIAKRGKNILVEFAKWISDIKKQEIVHESIDQEKMLLKELSAISTEVSIFASIFKSVYKGKKDIDVEEIRNLDFQVVKNELLDENLKQEMREIALRNYSERGKLRPFAESVVFPSLDKALEHGNNRFVILKKDGRIVSFLRFEDTDDAVYFGSFNANPDAIGSGIGGFVMDKELNAEAKKHPIIANVELNNPVASVYTNKYGFVATRFLENIADTGVHGFDILRDDTKNSEYMRARVYDLDAVITPDMVDKQIGDRRIIVWIQNGQNDGDLVTVCKRLINEESYVLTCIDRSKDKNGQLYFFEKISEEKKGMQHEIQYKEVA